MGGKKGFFFFFFSHISDHTLIFFFTYLFIRMYIFGMGAKFFGLIP